MRRQGVSEERTKQAGNTFQEDVSLSVISSFPLSGSNSFGFRMLVPSVPEPSVQSLEAPFSPLQFFSEYTYKSYRSIESLFRNTVSWSLPVTNPTRLLLSPINLWLGLARGGFGECLGCGSFPLSPWHGIPPLLKCRSVRFSARVFLIAPLTAPLCDVRMRGDMRGEPNQWQNHDEERILPTWARNNTCQHHGTT